MKLIYLGQELDAAIEQNLNSDNEYGYKVTILYARNSSICRHEGYPCTEVRNNCTQVHSLWRSMEDDETCPPKRKRIAFESDLHWTGGWQLIDDIEQVTIELAEKMEDEHFK